MLVVLNRVFCSVWRWLCAVGVCLLLDGARFVLCVVRCLLVGCVLCVVCRLLLRVIVGCWLLVRGCLLFLVPRFVCLASCPCLKVFVVCYLLCVVDCCSFLVCSLLIVVWCVLIDICRRWLLVVVCWLLDTLWFNRCYVLYVGRLLSGACWIYLWRRAC